MKLFNAKDLADYLGTTPASIYSLRNQIKRRLIPANRLPVPVPNGPLRWHPDVVDAWARVRLHLRNKSQES